MLNRVSLIGYLGNDPESQFLPSGSQVVKFSLATTENWKDKVGEWQKRTEWHNVLAFNKLAELCTEYLKKGALVYVEGKIQYRSWDDKDGVKKYRTEILINTMKMLDKKKGNDKGGADPEDPDVPF
jgi:single-strand DNA-binding protein